MYFQIGYIYCLEMICFLLLLLLEMRCERSDLSVCCLDWPLAGFHCPLNSSGNFWKRKYQIWSLSTNVSTKRRMKIFQAKMLLYVNKNHYPISIDIDEMKKSDNVKITFRIYGTIRKSRYERALMTAHQV